MNDANAGITRRRAFYCELSFWSLLIANIISIVWALKEGLSLELMIWVYFSQNIILGIFWPAKVIDSLGDSFYAKKIQEATAFLPPYLIIHFFYAFTLYDFFGKELSANIKYILSMSGIFFVSEIVSYLFEYSSLSRPKPLSLSKVLLFPYARIAPMHFVMLYGLKLKAEGTNPQLITIYFLLLKALADMAMYMVERSSIFNILAAYEKHKKWFTLNCLKEEKEVCRLCQKAISRNESPKFIKENAVCPKCYNRIEEEKRKTI
jgi:hypothetical protein